jgi:hypothetical protein
MQSTPITLIKEGTAVSTIVLSAFATAGAKDAAHELQHYLSLISGAIIPIKSEDVLLETELAGPLILVGESELARECGLDIESLKPEGFIIRTVDNRLLLAGREDSTADAMSSKQQGTSYAVTTFLEDYLGVRWLWPGESGEVVPRCATVVISPVARTEAPQMIQRQLRDSFLWQNDEVRWRCEVLGISEVQRRSMAADSVSWLRRQRLGRSAYVGAEHAFEDWYEKYHETHPDWFALHLNGSREWPTPLLEGPDRAKLCLSNPEVLDQFTHDAVEFFKKNPSCLMVSAAPNDSAYTGNCMCDECKSWDVPEALHHEFLDVGPDGELAKFQYPFLTDRHVRFYNLAAERLAREVPGKLVCGFAYTAYQTPPLRESLHDDVLIGFVGFSNYLSDREYEESLEHWNAWAKNAKNLYLRPNSLVFTYGFPLFYARRLAEDIRRGARDGMIAADFDTLVHHWGAQGIDYYVLAKVLWNPEADFEEIVADYCRSGFGPAALVIRAYYDALEKVTNDISAHDVGYDYSDIALTLATIVEPETWDELGIHLENAKSLAAGDEDILKRIDFVEVGLRYAILQSKALRAVQAAGNGDLIAEEAKRDAIDARLQFYRDHSNSFAISTVDSLFVELLDLAYNERILQPRKFYGMEADEVVQYLQPICSWSEPGELKAPLICEEHSSHATR